MPELPDRYGAAVRARRAELRAERHPLSGTHRAELRTELALSRHTAADALEAALGRVADTARAYAEHPRRAVRRTLPAALASAVAAGVREAHGQWAGELAPALRRVAGARRLALGPEWPVLPGAPEPPPPPPPPGRAWLAGAVEGLALWRLALVAVAALPLAGLPALGGPGWAPVGVGAFAAGVALLVRARRLGVERAALLRWVDAALAATRAAAAADLDRALLRIEPALAAELDAAVALRRPEVEDELRAVTGG